MVNAKPRDTRAGFDLYCQAGREPTLAELNENLTQLGYGPIRQRTLTHYRNLRRAGFNRYISINRFDVARASRAYENLSSLGRYPYRKVDLTVRVRIIKSGRLLDVHGRATSVGDVGASIQLSGQVVRDLNSFKPRTRNLVVLEYIDVQEIILGVLVDIDRSDTHAMIEVEYTGLSSVATVREYEPVSTKQFTFTISSEDLKPKTIDTIGRNLYYFFDLLEGVRALTNEAGQSRRESYYISPPILKELSLASPITITINLSVELVNVIPWALVSVYLVSQIARIRKLWFEGTTVSVSNELLRDVIQIESERISQQEQQLTQEIRDRVRSIVQEMGLSDRQIEELVERHVLPSLKGLGTNGVNSIRINKSD